MISKGQKKRRWGFLGLVLTCGAITFYWLYSASAFLRCEGTCDFLRAMLNEQENTAQSYISDELRAAALERCPEGRITRCIEIYNLEVEPAAEVYFGYGRPGETNVTLLYFSAERMYIVAILSVEQNEQTVVTGWRGFIRAGSEDEDSGFLTGERIDNQFP